MEFNYEDHTERPEFGISVTEEEFDNMMEILSADESIDSSNLFWDVGEIQDGYRLITCDGEYTYEEMSRLLDQAKVCIKENWRWSDLKNT